MSTPTDPERRMAAALQPFGWTVGPEFWKRYHSDPWVFNLANAIERLAAQVLPEGAPELPFGVLPRLGTVWCWEPLKDHARELAVVQEVRWNGEEWWIKSARVEMLVQQVPVIASDSYFNSLDRWIEATVFVAVSVAELPVAAGTAPTPEPDQCSESDPA